MTRAEEQLDLFAPRAPLAEPGASQSAQAHVLEERAIRDARERGDLTARCVLGCSHQLPPPPPEPDDGVARNRYGFPLTATVEWVGPDWKAPPPEAAPAPGDRIRFTPHVDRRRLVQVEGLVFDVLNDGAGFNVHTPVEGDPGRVVRVWLSDGQVHVLSRATDAPPGV